MDDRIERLVGAIYAYRRAMMDIYPGDPDVFFVRREEELHAIVKLLRSEGRLVKDPVAVTWKYDGETYLKIECLGLSIMSLVAGDKSRRQMEHMEREMEALSVRRRDLEEKLYRMMADAPVKQMALNKDGTPAGWIK